MALSGTAQLLLFLSVTGTITLLVFGVLFKNNYQYLGEYEGDYAATATVCFQSALAFAVLGILSALAMPVAACYERRKARRRALVGRTSASKISTANFTPAESW
jgi:hypothetical protein